MFEFKIFNMKCIPIDVKIHSSTDVKLIIPPQLRPRWKSVCRCRVDDEFDVRIAANSDGFREREQADPGEGAHQA